MTKVTWDFSWHLAYHPTSRETAAKLLEGEGREFVCFEEICRLAVVIQRVVGVDDIEVALEYLGSCQELAWAELDAKC